MNTYSMRTRIRTRAISVVELIVAVVVLGVVAAMTIPQFSQAAAPNDADADLRNGLAVLRTAIEMYYNDHDVYPASKGAGIEAAPAGAASAFIRQLTQFTDAEGNASLTSSTRFCFGPYLRDGVPACPVAVGRPSAKVHIIGGETAPGFDRTNVVAGWVYNAETGYIAANSPGTNERGMRYDAY